MKRDRDGRTQRSVVTGGAGFIGSNLVDALRARGDEVLVVDDLSSGRMVNLESRLGDGVELAKGSISDAEFLFSVIDEFGPDRIFHLAAQIDVRRSVEDPHFDAGVNVLGTINVLEAARRRAGTAVLLASTGGAIYGEGEGRQLPFGEDSAPEPEAPYGTSKLCAEAYIALYRRLYEVPAVALRLGNVYGPRQDPAGEAGVVAIFCGLLEEGASLKVFGDGLQTRDYVFVGDVVDAFVTVSERLRADAGQAPAGPYNVGTGREVSVIELAEELSAVTGAEAEITYLPARAGEVQRVAVDAGAAGRDFGWSAATNLTDGLAATYSALTSAGS